MFYPQEGFTYRNFLMDVPTIFFFVVLMKRCVLSIALSALVAVAVSTTAQAYYHHRHHRYWHHGGYPLAAYWNYYRTFGPGRGNSVESTR